MVLGMGKPIRWILLSFAALVLTSLFQPPLIAFFDRIGWHDTPDRIPGDVVNWLAALVGEEAFPWVAAGILGAAIGAWGHWIATKFDRRYLPEQPNPKPFTAEQIAVYGKTFSMDVVDIDGRSFHECKFNAVTLRYSGNGPYSFVKCRFNAPIGFDIPDERIAGVLGIVKLANDLGIPFIFGEDEPPTGGPGQPQSPPNTEGGKQP